MSTFIPEHSTNEIYRDENLSRFLTTDLEDIESTLANKSDSNHTHSGYATTEHTHASSEIMGLSDALALKADVSAITAKADLVDGTTRYVCVQAGTSEALIDSTYFEQF